MFQDHEDRGKNRLKKHFVLTTKKKRTSFHKNLLNMKTFNKKLSEIESQLPYWSKQKYDNIK